MAAVKVAPFAPTTQLTSGPHDLSDEDRERHYQFKLSLVQPAAVSDGGDDNDNDTTNDDGTPILPIDDVNKLGDDDLIFRHLIAKKWDFAVARQSLKDYAAFRSELKVNTIFSNWAFESPLIRAQMSGYFGHDREGYPVYYDRPQPSEINKLLTDEPREALIAWHVMVGERGRFLAKKAGMDRMTVVTDLRHIGMSIIGSPSAMRLMKEFSHIDQHRYPENMRVLCIINAPFTFKAIWAAVKPLLEERVQKKMRVCSRLSQMFEVIPEDAVPTEFGGTATGFKKLGEEYDAVRAEMIAATREPTPPQPQLNRIASVREKVRVRRGSVCHAVSPSAATTPSSNNNKSRAPHAQEEIAHVSSSGDDDDEEPEVVEAPDVVHARGATAEEVSADPPAAQQQQQHREGQPHQQQHAAEEKAKEEMEFDEDEITEYDPYEVGSSPPSTSTAAASPHNPWSAGSPLPGVSVPGSPRQSGQSAQPSSSPTFAGGTRRGSLDLGLPPRQHSQQHSYNHIQQQQPPLNTTSTSTGNSMEESARAFSGVSPVPYTTMAMPGTTGQLTATAGGAPRPAAPMDDEGAGSPRHLQVRSIPAPAAATPSSVTGSVALHDSFSAPVSTGGPSPVNASPIEILNPRQPPQHGASPPSSSSPAAAMLTPSATTQQQQQQPVHDDQRQLATAAVLTASLKSDPVDPSEAGAATAAAVPESPMLRTSTREFRAAPPADLATPPTTTTPRVARRRDGHDDAMQLSPRDSLRRRQQSRDVPVASPRRHVVAQEEASGAAATVPPLLRAPVYPEDDDAKPWVVAAKNNNNVLQAPEPIIGFALLPTTAAVEPTLAASRDCALSPPRLPVRGVPDRCSPARGRSVFATADDRFDWVDAVVMIDDTWETLAVRAWPSRRHLASLALESAAAVYPVDSAEGRALWGLSADPTAAPFVVAVEADPSTVATSSTAAAGPAIFGRARNPTVLVAFGTAAERAAFVGSIGSVYGDVVRAGAQQRGGGVVPLTSIVALPVSL